MQEVTLGLAILLAVGILLAKIGQKFKIPAVTCYILSGLLLGPSGFGLITTNTIAHQLDHFTEIALMLIAFGIGEQIEIKRLRESAMVIGLISFLEAAGAFLFVAFSSFFLARFVGVNCDAWTINEYFVLVILLGSISVATAPATTLHVMRELRAKGPLTSTLMAVVATNNGMAIMAFGIAMSVSGHVIGSEGGSISIALMTSMAEISFSLVIGMMTGLAISFSLPWLKRHDEMLTGGLALLLLCGEISRLMHLSPLLAGMAAGFTLINRVTRDVRLFRVLNKFEPPIYVLFFTLAGSHLDISCLGGAGWMGLSYFIFRFIGKYSGSYCGAWLAKTTSAVRKYLGIALVPQAGVAIGLIFLLGSDSRFAEFSSIITPVVLTGVICAEILGPIFTRIAMVKSGETTELEREDKKKTTNNGKNIDEEKINFINNISLVPWKWKKLVPLPDAQGVVVFGASHPATVCGLARIATILAHHFNAFPLSIRIIGEQSTDIPLHGAFDTFFIGEKEEVNSLGYNLNMELVQNKDVAAGLVAAVRQNNAKALVLGYPVMGTLQGFQNILEDVANNIFCPLVVVKFCGEMHTERILVPITRIEDLENVGTIVRGMSRVGEHRITILFLLPGDETDEAVKFHKEQLSQWANKSEIKTKIAFLVKRTEARQETILKESEKNDLVVMGTSKKNVLRKFLFGSLAETVVQRIQKPVLIVCRPSGELIKKDTSCVNNNS